MGSSYRRDIENIRDAAGSAFGRQRDVLESAARILADASRLAARFGRNDVAPRLRDEYESHLAPLVASGLAGGKKLLAKTPVAHKKSGLGSFIATGLAIAAVAGVAYVAWQVLRTDDEAWVDDDFDVD